MSEKLSLRLESVAEPNGILPAKIDKVEIGQTFNWDIYNKLYNFYNPKIDLIPVDPGYHADRRRDGRFLIREAGEKTRNCRGKRKTKRKRSKEKKHRRQ